MSTTQITEASIILGGKSYFIEPCTCGQLKRVLPIMDEVVNDRSIAAVFEQNARVVAVALETRYPDQNIDTLKCTHREMAAAAMKVYEISGFEFAPAGKAEAAD